MEERLCSVRDFQTRKVFIVSNDDNGLFRDNGSFVCKQTSTGTQLTTAENSNYGSDDTDFNGNFIVKRNYDRRKERKLLKAEYSTRNFDQHTNMNGDEDKLVPRPPDTPKSPRINSNRKAMEGRGLPPLRGAKLPPIKGLEQDSSIGKSSPPPAALGDMLLKKTELRSIAPLSKKNNDPIYERADSSSGQDDDDSFSDTQDMDPGDTDELTIPLPMDDTDGGRIKNLFKKNESKVLHRQTKVNNVVERESPEHNSTEPKATENDVLQSYEDYMRKVTLKDDDVSVTSDEYTVSSMSDDSEEGDDSEDNQGLSHSPQMDTITEGMYSLPMKKSDKSKSDKQENSMKNLFGQSTRLTPIKGSAESSYVTMNNFKLLRSLSDPNLRRNSLGQLKSLRTNTYLTPVDQDFISQLYAANNALARKPSTSSTDSQSSNLKFRPLPPIPASQGKGTGNTENLYETLTVCPNCQLQKRKQFSTSQEPSTDSTKSKLSFKTVANTVISVMPRLTTQEARSRKLDKTLADIKKYLPDHKLRIFLGTWNMKGTKLLPPHLDDFLLPSESVYVQDIYAIGTQEGTPFRREWELRLQETLGPSHVLIHSCNFGVLHLSIFVRREIIWYCTGLEQDSVATRMGHKIKTKGALAVSFTVFGTSFLFINSHFTSDEGKLKDRLNDYRNICRSLSMALGINRGGSEDDVTTRFDRVFWLGDFNFRVKKSRGDVDKLMAKHSDKKSIVIKELLQHDQLLDMLNKGKLFNGFTEHPVNFMPTYKFDVNTDKYDTSAKRRVPSWTDRVLMRSSRPNQIEVTSYNCCDAVKNSDHRPVYCVVEASIEPIKSKYTIPGGRFDRDLYVEANLRRNAPSGTQAGSNVCVIL